jgi:hypothetical protein
MDSRKISPNKIIWLILFSIAMGYLESAVVVYLREIYYPGGFSFPLVPVNEKDIIVELGREAATIIMLLGIGILSGNTKAQRFAFFLMAFGIWDIFYYVFLKLLLGWPAGLMDWDILFLIPLPWVGPVWAPCLLSLTMIFLAAVILKTEQRHKVLAFYFHTWIWWLAGSLIVIFSFCIDTLGHLADFKPGSPSVYVPLHYDWWLFILGELILLLGIFRLYRFRER